MVFMCVYLWAVIGSAVATMVIGFLWYSPFLFGKPWMLAMGYDPDDKAKIAEMQKTAGPKYGVSFRGEPAERVRPRQAHFSSCHLYGAVWDEGRLRGVAGFCDDRAVDRQALHQSSNETFPDQYRLPVGLLPGDGSDSGEVGRMLKSMLSQQPDCRERAPPSASGFPGGKGVLRNRAGFESLLSPATAPGNRNYSMISPPVSSASSGMSCSTQYSWSSSTIFSVAHGSQ